MKILYTILTLTVLIFLAVHFSSCRKILGTGNIKGKVLTKGTDAPVNAAHVEVFHEEKDIFSNLGSKVGEGWTAPDGSFSIDYDAPSKGSIYVTAKSAGYIWNLTENTKYKDLNRKLEIRLTPEAWLKLHLKNINPYNSVDKISIYVGQNTPKFFGNKVDTTIILRVDGNEDNVIAQRVVKNSETTYSENQIYCSGHDTTYHEILY